MATGAKAEEETWIVKTRMAVPINSMIVFGLGSCTTDLSGCSQDLKNELIELVNEVILSLIASTVLGSELDIFLL